MHCENFVVNHKLKHVLAPQMLSPCYKRSGSCFKQCVYRVMDAVGKFPRASITRYTHAKHGTNSLLRTNLMRPLRHIRNSGPLQIAKISAS